MASVTVSGTSASGSRVAAGMGGARLAPASCSVRRVRNSAQSISKVGQPGALRADTGPAPPVVNGPGVERDQHRHWPRAQDCLKIKQMSRSQVQ